MSILIAILLLMVVGAGFALMTFSDSTQNDTLKEIEELEELARERKKAGKEEKQEVKESHPLELIRNLSSKLNRYLAALEKRTTDKDYLNNFIITKDKVESNLRTLSVERMLLTIQKFNPIVKEFGIDLDNSFLRLNEELSVLAFSLHNQPDNIFVLEQKSAVFKDFETGLFQLDSDYSRIQSRGIPLSKLKSVIQGWSDPEMVKKAASEEVVKLINFYFSIRICALFYGFHEIHFEEIARETFELKKSLDQAKEEVDDQLIRRFEYHQNRLLDFLENYHNWYYNMYEGIRRGLDMIMNLEFIRIPAPEETISDMLKKITEEFLPISSEFAIAPRSGSVAYKANFEKLKHTFEGTKNHKPVPIGMTSSLQVYLDSRQIDCQVLTSSELGENVLNFLDEYLQGVCDFSASKRE